MAESVAKIRLALEGQPAVVAGIKEVERQFGSLKSGMAGLVSGLTIGALAAVVKNAIDAADEMSKLSQKTGVAVKDLAGLQLAFQQSGLGGDVLEKSMARLGRSMADGNKAFAAMGVNVKTAEGALRPMRDVLGDVADKFATYADGAAKTALAQEVFGKSGAEMIPLLNSGSDALAEMDDWARRLGLTMSEDSAKQAEQFNDTLDLLGMGVQGVWRQIAAQLLPTLTTLAGEMLSSATDTGALTTASAVLGNTLKGLYTVAASGVQIFSNLGRFVGAAAAAIVAVTQGNFAGAKDIMAQVQVDNATAWQKQVDSLKRLWNDAGGAGVQAMATVAAAANRAAPIVEKPGNSAKKSLKQAKDVAMELYQQLTMKDVGLDPKFFQQLNQLHGLYTSGRIGIDEYRKAVELLTEKQEFAKQIRQDLISQAQLANQIAEQAIDAEEKHRQTVEGQIKTGREMLENIKFETAALQMTNAEREVAIALRELERQGIVDGTEAYAAYAEQIRAAVLNRETVEEAIEAQRTLHNDNQKMVDQFGQSLADALMKGGKSGWEYIKGLFRQQLVMRIGMIISGAIGSLFGGAAMAGQGGGGMSLLNIGSSAANLLSGGSLLTRAGSWLGTGMGWLTGTTAANTAIGTGLGLTAAEATAASTAAASAGGTTSLAAIPGWGWAAAAALAILGGSGAFSRKHAQHNLEGVFGGETGFDGNWHDYWKGGMFRSSKTENTPLDSTTLNALRAAWKAQEAAITDYAKVLGLSTENIEGFTYRINLKLKDLGDPSDAGYMDKVWQMVNEAISTGSNEMAERILGTWTTTTREVEETIRTGFWDNETFSTVKRTIEETTYTASEYAREGERAIDTLTRLATSLQATNAAFDMLGLSLYEASLAGGDMASKLIDQMGGMDAFGAQVGAYWQNYYTEAERHAYMTGKMTEALAAAGLVMPTTVAGFRALVDAQDLTTDAGRAAFAALMSVNAAFTEVYGNADAAAGSIADLGDELAALEPIVFGAASDLASVIEQGLLGTLTGAQLGEQMADVVMQGMYSAIAGGFSQQITALMVEGVLNPMIAAAMTGASMSAAVSQAAIDRVIQHAQAAAAAINAVLSDPGFQAAIQQVQAAVGSISVGIQRPEPIYDSYAAQNARALAAQREAERLADEAQRAADQRAREAQQLAEQQAREAQRLADEEARYWQAVYSERQGLLKQLWTLEGNVAAVRQAELEALDPSNRALQTRIWQLQDEKTAVEQYNAALKNAQEFLGGFTRNIQEFIFKVSHAQATAAEGYQLAAAKFSAQLVLARGGDRDALGSITGYADTLIESIRRESTTGAEANLRIARVLGQLGELPQQVSAEQLIVDAIASGTSTTVNALSNLQSSLINELIGGFDQLDTTMDGKLSFSELQTALAGKATDAEIAALIARVDTNSDGQISKLEAVRAAAATTATNVGTVNTSVGTVNTSVGTWGSNQYTRLGAVDSSVGYWGNAQTNATNAILNYQSVQTAGTYADFRADYQYIRNSVDDVYDAIRAMHFTDGTNSIARMRAQVDEVRNNSFPLYVKSEHRAGTMMTFEAGGYTGHGGRFEPAGIVHRGEGVLNQDDIRALGGPAGFEALRRSLKRGYADGGLVAPVPFVAPILRQGSDPEIKRLLRELVDEARNKEINDRVRHSTLLNQASRQTEIMERQENIGMPRTRKENAVVV